MKCVIFNTVLYFVHFLIFPATSWM